MSCDRLEDEHLLADLGAALDAHVDQCADCSARLRGYQTIAALIAEGATSHRAPADWGQRTLARVKAARRSRQRRVATLSALSVAAAAAIVLVYLRWSGGLDSGRREVSFATVARNGEPTPAELEPSPSPKLAVQIVGHGGWRGVAHPGEEVHARAIAPDAPYVEIRVYREARSLVVRCPEAGNPVCPSGEPGVLIWKVPAVGTYQVLLVVSLRPIAAPRGSLEDDVAAATAEGARVVGMERLDVR